MKRQIKYNYGAVLGLAGLFAFLAYIFFDISDCIADTVIAFIFSFFFMLLLSSCITAVIQPSANNNAKIEQQERFAKAYIHDTSFGNGDLRLYSKFSSQKVAICATTANGSKLKIIENFIINKAVETDNHIVALDLRDNKVIRARNLNGSVAVTMFNINDRLASMGIRFVKSSPSLKNYNDYAFVTDDTNEFIAIVSPSEMSVLRYGDIVSVSYEENGRNVYNKSLEGAAVGKLLFGDIGAIVGSNTAKATQNKEITSMSIKILLNYTSNSTIILKIFTTGCDGPKLETKNDADRVYYEGLMKEVEGIKDIFSVILNIVSKKNVLHKVTSTTNAKIGLADELLKLAQLKDSGILSDEEFNLQKVKLLNR